MYIVLCRIIDSLSRVCKEYHERIGKLEDEKFDLEYIVKRKDMEVVRHAALVGTLLANSQTHKSSPSYLTLFVM